MTGPNFCNVARSEARFWRETLSLIDVMWPLSNQWERTVLEKNFQLNNNLQNINIIIHSILLSGICLLLECNSTQYNLIFSKVALATPSTASAVCQLLLSKV